MIFKRFPSILFSLALSSVVPFAGVHSHEDDDDTGVAGHSAVDHEALRKLPGQGRAIDDAIHHNAAAIGKSPWMQENINRFVKDVIDKFKVVQMYQNSPSDGRPELRNDGRRENQQLQERLKAFGIRDESKPLFQDLMAPPMTPIYKAIHFRLDPNVRTAVDPSPGGFAYSAQVNASEGRFAEAIADASKALQMDPNNVKALESRALSSYKLGDYRTAAADASRAMQINPDSAVAVAVVSAMDGRDHPVDMGIQAVSSKDELADNSSGAASGSQAAQAPAPNIAAGAPAVDPGLAGATIAQTQSSQQTRDARTALTIHDYNSAIASASKAIELNGNNAQAFVLRAIAQSKSGRLEEALRDADSALKLVPNNSVALDTRAYVLNRLRQYGMAKAAAERALQLDSNDADAWYQLAYAQAGLNDPAGMRAALEKAAGISPERFQNSYEAAVQAPESGDLTFLFEEGKTVLPGLTAAYAAQTRNQGRFMMIAIACLVGGFLVALGLLHLAIPDWAQRLTRRRRKSDGAPDPSPVLAAQSNGHMEKRLVAGNFEILQQIGSGGMGNVYQAMDRALERHVAVKKMRDEIRDDPKERGRFLKEARVVAALHHPNIVEIHSILEDEGDVFMIFELVDGESLEQILAKRGRLSFPEIKALFKGVCDALDYAHQKGIVHRDLKPSNIMVNYQDQIVKVMDFGIARQAQEALSKLATSTVAGTPPYMAPEAEQGAVRRESDIYALGVCLYQMLTGELPFVGTGAGMLLNKMNMNYQPPSKWIQNVPPGLDALFQRALQPDPVHRLKSAAEFYQMLAASPPN